MFSVALCRLLPLRWALISSFVSVSCASVYPAARPNRQPGTGRQAVLEAIQNDKAQKHFHSPSKHVSTFCVGTEGTWTPATHVLDAATVSPPTPSLPPSSPAFFYTLLSNLVSIFMCGAGSTNSCWSLPCFLRGHVKHVSLSSPTGRDKNECERQKELE